MEQIKQEVRINCSKNTDYITTLAEFWDKFYKKLLNAEKTRLRSTSPAIKPDSTLEQRTAEGNIAAGLREQIEQASFNG